MPYRSRRKELGIGRGGAVALVAGTLIIFGALWIGPLRPLPAELRLLALTADGEFADSVFVAAERPDAIAAAADVVARAPLVLAVQNVGTRAATPSVLRLSLPARFRLTDRAGDPLAGRSAPGTPLVQYEFTLPFPELRPRDMPTILPSLDTLWIEAVLPEFHCNLIIDAVPEFIPAPPYDPSTLAPVRIFWALDANASGRQSGLLTVDIDPALLARPTASMPERARITMHREPAPRPDLGPLTQIGTRSADCGDPEAPIPLHTVLWEGQTGALMYEVAVGATPRKLLFDLNRDGRVDLEIWDAEGDGGFRTIREARYPVPSLLRPLPTRLALRETVEVDSIWLARFYDVQAGPYRFFDAPEPIDDLAAAERSAAERSAHEPAPPPPIARAATPVDSAWLERFLDTRAGPFRFTDTPPRLLEPASPPAAPEPPAPAAPTPAEPPPAAAEREPPPPAAPATPPPDTARPATPRPRPRLLGTPVPWPPRDTANSRQ
jgi:hypothetical protein